jgi:hypothetical protein
MAEQIASIASSAVRKVDKRGFYAALRFGDAVMCQGNYKISKAIERETNSCLSHILVAQLPPRASCWLTAESTEDKGVHVGLMSDYVDKYDGDLVIVRRAGLTEDDRYAMMNAFYGVLECAYNTTEELTTVLHRLTHVLPIAQPKKEFYCTQLWKHMCAATSVPCGAGADGVNYTPEDAWRDPLMEPIAALCKVR